MSVVYGLPPLARDPQVDPEMRSLKIQATLDNPGRLLLPGMFAAARVVLSAQPDLSTGLGVWDFIGRKIVHITEYGVLCFLWWRAFRRLAATSRTALAVAFGVSLALFSLSTLKLQ